MQLIPRNAPHIRHSDNNKTVMGDAISALIPLYVIAFCYYGPRVLVLLAVSVLTCCILDGLANFVVHRYYNFRDFSPIVTGLIIPLMMPATAQYRMVVVTGAVAILVAKAPFGGVGENFFNPAAAGLAFAAACWPEKMFSYPLPFSSLPLWDTAAVQVSNSAAFSLKLGGVPNANLQDMLLGLLPGPMGATSALVILACLLFLAYRRTIRLTLPLSFLGAAALFAYVFPRTSADAGMGVLWELLSGSLLFGAVFMFTDPVTSPKRRSSCALYGAVSGLVTMIFRYYGGFEQAVPFALLLMNATMPLFDWAVETMATSLKRRDQDEAVSSSEIS